MIRKTALANIGLIPQPPISAFTVFRHWAAAGFPQNVEETINRDVNRPTLLCIMLIYGSFILRIYKIIKEMKMT